MTVVEEGNVFIRYEENEDGFPFCIISPVFDPYCVVPSVSGMDSVGQWQDLLTAIIRLTVQNLALNNNPQQLCNSASFVDFNQVLDGDQFVEINGLPSEAMGPVAEIPLAPYTLNLIEMVKGWSEEASNTSRVSQGIEPDTATKTYGGMKLLANMGSQATELIMRNIAETGLRQLFLRMVFLNQKYIDHDQVIRLTNKDITVNKDNLKGDIDYIVSSGMGAGAKETDVQNIMMLKQDMPILMQAGLADLKCAYNVEKKYLELIGIRNVDDYILDPEQQKQQQQPEQQPVSESLRMDFNTMPIPIKIQILAKSGIQATPEMFIEQMKLEAQMKAQEEQAKQQADMQKTVVQAQIQDHQSDKQHQHGMQAAHMNNTAKERQVNLVEQNRQTAERSNREGIHGRNSGSNEARPAKDAMY